MECIRHKYAFTAKVAGVFAYWKRIKDHVHTNEQTPVCVKLEHNNPFSTTSVVVCLDVTLHKEASAVAESRAAPEQVCL